MKKSRNNVLPKLNYAKLNYELTDTYGQVLGKAKQINIEDGLIEIKKIMKHKIGR